MVEFLPFYFFYSLLFQLSSVDMYISTKGYFKIRRKRILLNSMQ